MNRDNAVQDASKLGTGVGALVIILGMIAMFAPMVAGMSISIMVGMILLFAGICQVIFAFKAATFGKGIVRSLFGGITVIAGVVMIVSPAVGLMTLTMGLIFYFIIEGTFTIMMSLQIKPQSGWKWMLFSGLTTLFLGFVLWSDWPLSGIWAIGILVGIRLILSGISIIVTSKAIKNISEQI